MVEAVEKAEALIEELLGGGLGSGDGMGERAESAEEGDGFFGGRGLVEVLGGEGES